jgi:hypothetical protein
VFQPLRGQAVGGTEEGADDSATVAVIAADHGICENARFDISTVCACQERGSLV